MTILVLSDSHGRSDNVSRAIEAAGRVDAILFLGDGLRDVEYLSTDAPIYSVRGNCDYFSSLASDAPDERIICLGEYNILMMHGHTHSVKDSPERAIAYAAGRGADILIFGHTHERHEEHLAEGSTVLGVKLEKPMWVMNPGSIGSSANGYSFGIITIRKKDVLLSFGKI